MASFSLILVAVFAAGILGMSHLTPTGFLSEEDQGAFFTSVRLPDGASVARTNEVTKQIEDVLKEMPAVEHVLAIVGFSLLDGASEPNSALVVTRLKPFADRKAVTDSAQALIRQIYAASAQIRQANVLPFNMLPIIGLSTSGGFEYQLQALGRIESRRDLQCHGCVDRSGQCRSAADASILDLHLDQSIDLSRHRSA